MVITVIFQDRTQAGSELAKALTQYAGSNAVIIGLSRGGVSVASATAARLELPMDVLVVKKISSPNNSEYALGAVAPDNVTVISWKQAQQNGIDRSYIEEQIELINRYIAQKTFLYRRKKKPLRVKGKIVILIDDGMATGLTLEAAIKWCKAKKVQKIIVAVPVASQSAVRKVAPEADVCTVLDTPPDFQAVGQYYREFNQLTDENVIELLP